MKAVEVLMHKRQTQAMIRADPADIQLQRRPVSTNGAGASTLGQAQPLPSQQFRLVPNSNPQAQLGMTTEGEMESAEWLLLGRHDADVERNDEFVHNGVWYRVQSIHTDRVYQTVAALKEFGSAS